jgi:hypothetical protein
MENEIIKLIEEKGPLTGSEIHEALDEDTLLLWRACRSSKNLVFRITGTRYLRLDQGIDGYARLSPSILREFLTYTLFGLPDDNVSLQKRADEMTLHLEKVSRSKLDMAYSLASTLPGRIGDEQLLKEQACFIIAGDIVFNMAHDAPRPERSTGKMVKGSDIDIVVIVDDKFPAEMIDRLDEEIYKEKYSLLINPYLREEIDYIVKNMDRVREQVNFDTFKHMVACKIMREGKLLYGSEKIFNTVKNMLSENKVIEKLTAMENTAREFRKKGEEFLMREDPLMIRGKNLYLFYPEEEAEEFE